MGRETWARLQRLDEGLRRAFSNSDAEVPDGHLFVTIVYQRAEEGGPVPNVEAYGQSFVADDFEDGLRRADTVFGSGSPEQVKTVSDAVVASVVAEAIGPETYKQVLWGVCRGPGGEQCLEELRSNIRQHNRASVVLVLDLLNKEADFIIGRDLPWSKKPAYRPKH